MNINNNRTVSLPEHFLHCLPMTAGNTSGDLFVQGGGMEMSVLERQRAALKLQQQQLHLLLQQQQQQEGEGEGERKGGFGQGAYSNNVFPFSPSFSPLDGAQFYGGNLVICGSGDNSQPNGISALTRPIKADPGVESVCPEFGGFVGAGDRRSTGVTASCNNNSGTACQPPVVDKESSKKRKAKEKTLHHPPKPGELEDGDRFKKIKGCSAERLQDCNRGSDQQDCSNRSNGSNKDNRIRDASGCCTSKENNNSKPAPTEPQKPDYIHVRARRGQATDSHSLAERVRREKISKRMKYLQDLVPGCNKITGKAGMLDEIINYVQSLQRQVEFLSMKLAAVNPGLEFNIDDFFAKEVFAACSSNYPTTMGLSSPDMAATNSAYDLQQFNNNPTQQHQIGQQICGGFDIGGMNEVVLDMGLRRTISAPVSLPPDNLLDSSCLTQQIESCMPWDNADLQSMYAMDFQ